MSIKIIHVEFSPPFQASPGAVLSVPTLSPRGPVPWTDTLDLPLGALGAWGGWDKDGWSQGVFESPMNPQTHGRDLELGMPPQHCWMWHLRTW